MELNFAAGNKIAIETGQEMIDLKLLESIDYQSPSERRRNFARITA